MLLDHERWPSNPKDLDMLLDSIAYSFFSTLIGFYAGVLAVQAFMKFKMIWQLKVGVFLATLLVTGFVNVTIIQISQTTATIAAIVLGFFVAAALALLARSAMLQNKKDESTED
jgi:hypothetical protein